jgi:hypothetical protein
MAVDLFGLGARRIGPVAQALVLDPAEQGVEIRFGDEESVMLARDLAFLPHEVHRHSIVELDHPEVEETSRRRTAEHLGQERRRAIGIAAPDDGVVELGRHRGSSIGSSLAQQSIARA